MEIICPKCGGYDCFFDGLRYVCDDCGNEWGEWNPNKIEEEEEW